MSDGEDYRRKEIDEERILAKINSEESLFWERERDRRYRRENERHITFPKTYRDKSHFRKREYERQNYRFMPEGVKKCQMKSRRDYYYCQNKYISIEREKLRLERKKLEQEKIELSRQKREAFKRKMLEQKRQENERKRVAKNKLEKEKLRRIELKYQEQYHRLPKNSIIDSRNDIDKSWTISRRLREDHQSFALKTKSNGGTEVKQRPSAVGYYSPISSKSSGSSDIKAKQYLTDIDRRDRPRKSWESRKPALDHLNEHDAVNNDRKVSVNRPNLTPTIRNIITRCDDQRNRYISARSWSGNKDFSGKRKLSYSHAFGNLRFDPSEITCHSTPLNNQDSYHKTKQFWTTNYKNRFNESEWRMKRKTSLISLSPADNFLCSIDKRASRDSKSVNAYGASTAERNPNVGTTHKSFRYR